MSEVTEKKHQKNEGNHGISNPIKTTVLIVFDRKRKTKLL